MGDPGQSEWDPPISLRAKCREKIKKLQRDRVNGKGSAASSSVPRKRRSSGGACSRSCSSPKASEVEQAGSPQAPIFGRRETSDTPLGATRVLDRGKSILIAVENHVGGGGGGGGGGGECSYQAPETDSLEHPQNTRAVSQGHGHDKSKKKKANDAADTVAISSSTVPGNLFATAGARAAPAEGTTRGIRHRREKWEVEIRVAVAKQKLLGFERITLGVHDTIEQACVARNVGDFYCGKWPPACVISDPRILSSLLPLEKLDKLPPTEMKKQIQEIARCATLGCCTSRTHPGRGLINAAAAAPVQQEVEIKEGCSHFELDHVQQLDQAQGAAAAAAVNNPSSDLDQICSEYLGPDTTQQDDFPNTQELQHLPQQRSSHGTAAAGDSQTLEAADQLEAAALQEAAATNHVNIMDEDDQHSGGSWDVENALNLNAEEEGQLPCADWLNDFFDQFPGLMWEINSGNLQSDMELDQLDWENNLPILSDSTIPHDNVSTIANDNIQESEEYQMDETEFQQFLEQYCDEMQYQQMQF